MIVNQNISYTPVLNLFLTPIDLFLPSRRPLVGSLLPDSDVFHFGKDMELGRTVYMSLLKSN